MSYPINYPKPQGANVQIFREGGSTSDWVKPQGASFVWFTLIGAGGGGGGGSFNTADSIRYYGGGGASGNVSNFMCPAFLLPDVLRVAVGKGGTGGTYFNDGLAANGITGTPTSVIYQQKNNIGYTLVTAGGGSAGGAANGSFGNESNGVGGSQPAVDPGEPMTAAGFYNNTVGQAGANGGVETLNVDGLTFLNGGIGCRHNEGIATGYYGYTASTIAGYSQISPLIMSISGANSDASVKRSSPFGCGGNGGTDYPLGGATNGSNGGDGLAIIVTW